VSKTAFVGTCLLSAAVFASGGYLIGKSHQPAERTPTPSIPASPTPGPVSPSPAPVENTPPAVTPAVPPAVPKEALTPQQALREFLDAPDWKTRSARVLTPEEVRPKMEKYAAEHGDGPIPVTAIELLQAVGLHHIYKVSTTALPEGFWVGVTQTDEGPMIDWETFIGFHDDHFKKLLDGPVNARGQFDVLVKPEPDSPDQPHFGRYRLRVPMPGRETVAWIRKDSMGLARLRALFEGSSGIDKPTIDQAVAEEGIPMVLTLVKRQTNDGRGYIEIEDFIAVSWDPVDP
jgi:hypothetical protein